MVITIESGFWGLAGIGLNGRSLDGEDLGQRGLQGVTYGGVQIGRQSVYASLDGSVLTSSGPHGHSYTGSDFVGATLVGMLDNGSSITLQINGFNQDPNPEVSDVWLYTVSYATNSGYQPLCGVDVSGNPVQAVALAGRWNYSTGVAGGGSKINDPNAFTFACAGYALAKCVELGYEPWDSIRACSGNHGRCPNVQLADLHQACTRAIRADYCGNGTSFTVDGTSIDVYDGFGYRTASTGWLFEAEWTTDGARCARRLRVPAEGTPACWSSLQNPSCGSSFDFSAGALLMTQDSP
jgi:hypothetical protein